MSLPEKLFEDIYQTESAPEVVIKLFKRLNRPERLTRAYSTSISTETVYHFQMDWTNTGILVVNWNEKTHEKAAEED